MKLLSTAYPSAHRVHNPFIIVKKEHLKTNHTSNRSSHGGNEMADAFG
jgi:hypothetical protein